MFGELIWQGLPDLATKLWKVSNLSGRILEDRTIEALKHMSIIEDMLMILREHFEDVKAAECPDYEWGDLPDNDAFSFLVTLMQKQIDLLSV